MTDRKIFYRIERSSLGGFMKSPGKALKIFYRIERYSSGVDRCLESLMKIFYRIERKNYLKKKKK